MKNFLDAVGLLMFVFGVLLSIATFQVMPSTASDLAWVELFKFFLFSCAVGGAVILLRQFEALKDLAESRRIDLRNVRSQVIHAMHAIQSVRRLLRVHSTKEGETVRILNASRWFELIEKLNESQLEIERLRRVHLLQIASGPVDAKVLGANLKQIDDYIRALLREFEALDGLDEPILNLAGSPKVSEFLFAELPPKYVQAFSAIEASFVEEAMRLGPLNTLKS